MNRTFSNFMFAVLLFLAAFTIPSFAQNQEVMNVHVDKAVAIPGNVLTPGDYVFRLADSTGRPDDVEIRSADGKTSYGFIQIYMASRNTYEGSEVKVSAADSTGLERIDSWFFPGSEDGYRFIYSKSDLQKADQIAQRMQTEGTSSGQ
jgi:hypothetical protein